MFSIGQVTGFAKDYFSVGAPVKVTVKDVESEDLVFYGFVLFVSDDEEVMMIASLTVEVMQGRVRPLDLMRDDQKLAYSYKIGVKEYLDGNVWVERLF